MIQQFHCKNCNHIFEITSETKYLNQKCPKCNSIAPFLGYLGIKLNIPNGTIKK